MKGDKEMLSDLEAWFRKNDPEAMDGPCKNGCCLGPICMRTYYAHGAGAAIMEAYAPKPSLLYRMCVFLRLRRKP